ncbi:2-oxoadipate dioxygenase/decarboxylase family protein [Jiulongibacter sp. NS-SX5]|uniref:2-oxoadipate dioxygenase/decarboxylase family protein n=1 Tax=Jiulongibacter sp. NS-SX5 TaxID=3463854 RepID=UPI00405A4451
MKFEENNKLSAVFNRLFKPYEERVPVVDKIMNAMVAHGIIDERTDIVNDHIAFRTLGVPHLGVSSFEKIFLHYGYEKRDYFHFEGKKLNAWWYSPPAEHYPRIFISELRVEDLSENARDIIHSYTSFLMKDPVDELDLNDVEAVGDFFEKSLWRLPTFEDYHQLNIESEYAAWVIYNRYYLNHYTISVHALPKGYNTLAQFNDFLESLGVKLNDAGGKIKTSPDGLLLQSSTVADMVEATFANGKTTLIPGSYLEFAERRPLPEFQHLPQSEILRKHRRDGFETGNADKIFESTFTTQTKR